MLTIAAVAGKEFRFDLLSLLGGLDEDRLLDALEEAEHATLVQDVSTGRDARYAFPHELIRQKLVSTLSFPRRQRWHLRIADALEQIYGAEVEQRAVELAHHLYEAGPVADEERTSRYLVLAGERAIAALAFEEALRHFDAALTVLPGDDFEVRARVLRLRALALRGAARTDEALATFAEGLELAPGGLERQKILYERARLQLDLFRGREAIDDLEKLLGQAREDGDREREVELMLALGRARYILSLDNPEYTTLARESYEQAYALARELGDRRSMAKALIPTHWFTDFWQDYHGQARTNIDEAAALAEELGDEDLAIECSTARLRLLPPAEMAAEAESLRARLEARRDPIRLKELYFLLMWHYWLHADFEQCVETCDAGIALAERLGSLPVQYPTIKALALMDLGRFDEGWRALQEEVTDEGHPFGQAMQRLGVAVYMDHLGALDRAADAARDLFDRAKQLSRTWMQRSAIDLLTSLSARMEKRRAEVRSHAEQMIAETGFQPSSLTAGEMQLAEGDLDRALDLADLAAQGTERAGLRRHRILALELKLRVLAKMRRWSEAISAADEALALAEETGFYRIAWRIRASRGRARLATGDRAHAEKDLAAARETLRAVAATILERDLRARFEEHPAAVELRTAGGPANRKGVHS
jgi:tetratricopeptide (TPR) repeat protein